MITYNDLVNMFTNKYGPFKHLLTGKIKQRLEKSSGFILRDENVGQCEEGALTAYFWHHQEFLPSPSINVTLENHSENANNEIENNHVSITDSDSQEQRTNQWVEHLEESNEDGDSPDLDWNEVAPLQKLLPEISLRYSFFLISGKNTPPDKFNGVSKIPWLKVYDFDNDTKNESLFSSVEKSLKEKRCFALTTSPSASKPLSNNSTEWIFPLGYPGMAETLFTGSPLTWFNENKTLLEKQFQSMANFCAVQTVPVFVILWYDPDKSNVKYLNWMLSFLYPAFASDAMPKHIIMCTGKTSSENSFLQEVVLAYELESTTIYISAENVYKWFARQKVPNQLQQNIVRLPGRSGIEEISDKSLIMWIQQYIEILSLESQDYITSRQRNTENFGKEFVKGNTISWDELASGKLAVQRFGKREIFKCLQSDVFEKQKSVVLRIQHAPGGGGTTLARQLLWDLHFKFPCGALVPTLTLSIAQISEGVRHLYDKTKLPVVLLIDGHSEFEIDQIFVKCKYAVVILHVLRYSKEIPCNEFLHSSRTCRLPGWVTAEEASDLTKVFSSYSQKSTKILKELTNDVKNNKERFVFEYGLAAFNHEFKGVRKYVQGYLKLHDQKDGVSNLLNWQRVVGYLSLAQYYAQSGIHRNTFRSLFHVQKFVTLEHLGYSGSQFIFETKGEWKISYNIVAKEILEQMLSSCTSTPTEKCDPELNDEAKKNLHELVIDFIGMIKTASKGCAPEILIQLLTNMIIRRNYSEVDKSDGIAKGTLSKLLEDMPIQQNRVNILKKLTEAFPQNPNFHAHLGRLLNIMKEFRSAEASLQTALDLRLQKCFGLGSKSTDDMLSRIHHMFGVGYNLQAQEAQKRATKQNYQNMLKFVSKAVDHFGEARCYATYNLSYGFIGEVNARLLVAEFVNDKFPNGCRKAFNFELGKDHIELSEFVRESHLVCDRLLAESLQYSTEQELERIRTYTRCIVKFNFLYGHIRKEMLSRQLKTESRPTISMRRSQIAFLKMKYRSSSKRPRIANVQNEKDLDKIIALYESIFREVFGGDIKHESVSVDVLEWLEAIRHPLAPNDYSLVRILQTVENWVKKNESGYATFYLYVVNFVLAIFSPGENLNKQYYNKTLELKEKLHLLRYKYDVKFWRMEWIAEWDNLTSIRKLINHNSLGVWDKDNRFWKEEKNIKKLQVFAGNVTRSHHPLKGTISLDVQSQHKCRIEVYFVPKLYCLDKSIYGEQKQRVEFCIGFSMEHGAEAYAVKILEKHVCSQCCTETEFFTINQSPLGTCRKCNISG